LFGSLSHAGRPIISLATPARPNAKHGHAHFSDDLEEFQRMCGELSAWAGLQLVGTWHSHHELRLREPSPGDLDEVRSLTGKNGYRVWAEFVTTCSSNHPSTNSNWWGSVSARLWGESPAAAQIEVNAFYYPEPQTGAPVRCPVNLIPGISPYRLALIANPALSESILCSGTWAFPLSRIAYDRLEESVPSTCGSEHISAHLAAQISELPDEIQRSLTITTREGLLVVSLPIGCDGRVLVAYAQTAPDDFHRIYLSAGEQAEAKDVTRIVRARSMTPSLVDAYRLLCATFGSRKNHASVCTRANPSVTANTQSSRRTQKSPSKGAGNRDKE
jgi:hypothetical protein